MLGWVTVRARDAKRPGAEGMTTIVLAPVFVRALAQQRFGCGRRRR
jgi:hypothetical protein